MQKTLLGWLQAHRLPLGILALYAGGGLLLLGWYRYQLNPDGVAYISIAAKYAHGQFGDALNGYWGPMLSWLLAPFAFLGKDMQLAAKLIALAAGGVVIGLSWLIAGQLKLRLSLRVLLAAVLVPLVWYWALPSPITPDLLIVVAVLAYVWLLLNRRGLWWQRALAFGAVGAAGFFIKSYFLPFFVMHFALWLFLEWRWHKTVALGPALRLYGLSLAVMGLLIAPWVIALSVKYHRPTISTSAAYNFNLLGPESKGHPMGYAGLLPPANASAVSVWEDPTYLPIKSWSPLESKRNLAYYGGVIVENLRVIGSVMLGFSVFALAIAAGVMVVYARHPRQQQNRHLALLFSVAAVYTAGYVFVVNEERYFWAVFITLLLLGGCLAAMANLHKTRLAYGLALGLTAVSVVWSPVSTLIAQRGTGLTERQGAAVLQPLFTGKERIASDTFNAITYCYYLKVPCYGALNDALGDETNRAQLKNNRITDVLLFNTGPGWQKPACLDGYEVVPTHNPAVTLLRLARP